MIFGNDPLTQKSHGFQTVTDGYGAFPWKPCQRHSRRLASQLPPVARTSYAPTRFLAERVYMSQIAQLFASIFRKPVFDRIAYPGGLLHTGALARHPCTVCFLG